VPCRPPEFLHETARMLASSPALPARGVCLLPRALLAARGDAGGKESDRTALIHRDALCRSSPPQQGGSNVTQPHAHHHHPDVGRRAVPRVHVEVTDVDRVQQSTAMSAAKYFRLVAAGESWTGRQPQQPTNRTRSCRRTGLAIYSRPIGRRVRSSRYLRDASGFARQAVGTTGESRSADQYSIERFCTERFHRWTSAFLRVRSSRGFGGADLYMSRRDDPNDDMGWGTREPGAEVNRAITSRRPIITRTPRKARETFTSIAVTHGQPGGPLLRRGVAPRCRIKAQPSTSLNSTRWDSTSRRRRSGRREGSLFFSNRPGGNAVLTSNNHASERQRLLVSACECRVAQHGGDDVTPNLSFAASRCFSVQTDPAARAATTST